MLRGKNEKQNIQNKVKEYLNTNIKYYIQLSNHILNLEVRYLCDQLPTCFIFPVKYWVIFNPFMAPSL